MISSELDKEKMASAFSNKPKKSTIYRRFLEDEFLMNKSQSQCSRTLFFELFENVRYDSQKNSRL